MDFQPLKGREVQKFFNCSRAVNPFSTLQRLYRAVREAASAADCVLATYQQLCAPGFPLEYFSCSVEYAPQAVLDLEAAKAAAALLGGQRELRHVLMIPIFPVLLTRKSLRGDIQNISTLGLAIFHHRPKGKFPSSLS